MNEIKSISRVSQGDAVTFFPEQGRAMSHWDEKPGKVIQTYWNNAGELLLLRLAVEVPNYLRKPNAPSSKERVISAESLISVNGLRL